ncbi:MAG: DnaJ domain-containing protein [Phycisphaerales bacterium]|nr:DnaJ domain-containing protein [Phycisphaerales bacterium]
MTESVKCELGALQDLSATGIGLLTRGKPPCKVGQIIPIRLRCTQGAVDLQGKIVRVRRAGLRTYDIGIEFVNLSSKLRAALASLAEFGFIGAKTTAEESDTASNGRPRLTSKAAKSTANGDPNKVVMASTDLPNYYAVLGLNNDASVSEIQAAYRALVRKYHPDVAPGEENLERFLDIKRAYEILRDPSRRKIFDQQIAA